MPKKLSLGATFANKTNMTSPQKHNNQQAVSRTLPTKTTNPNQGSCTLNGDASLLFISSCVCEARIACGFCRDNSCLANQRVGQSGLAVIHMRNDTHGADVIRLVHDLSHLVHREVRHGRMKAVAKLFGTTRLQSMTGTAAKSAVDKT